MPRRLLAGLLILVAAPAVAAMVKPEEITRLIAATSPLSRAPYHLSNGDGAAFVRGV